MVDEQKRRNIKLVADRIKPSKPEKSGYFNEFKQYLMPLISTKKQKQAMWYIWSVAKDEFKNLLAIM